MTSVRPPGNKFCWSRDVLDWVMNPDWWTRADPETEGSDVTAADHLEYDAKVGLHLPQSGVDDYRYTYGFVIDPIFAGDIRVIAKWNTGTNTGNGGRGSEQIVGLRLKTSESRQQHLLPFLFTESFDHDYMGMGVYPVDYTKHTYWDDFYPPSGGYTGSNAIAGGIWANPAYGGPGDNSTINGLALEADTDYWLLAEVVGDTIKFEHWSTDPLKGGSPVLSGTMTMTAASGSWVDYRPILGAGVPGRVGIGWTEPSFGMGFKSFRAWDLSGGKTFVMSVGGIRVYTSDYLGSGGPTAKTIDGTEDVYTQPITILGAYPAHAYILESVGSVAPTFSIHNSGVGQLRWQIHNSVGSTSGMPNGVTGTNGTATFDLVSKGPGRYFLVVSFDSAPHTGSYEITTGPAGELVAPPDLSLVGEVEVLPPS